MSYRTYSLIGLFAALLAACTSTPVAPPVDNATLEAQAQAAMARGDYVAAATAYEQLSRRSDGDAQTRYQIALARAEIGLGMAEAALARLDGLAPPPSDAIRAELMAARAEALFALGRTVEAVRVLVDREIWLDTPAAILDNQTRIWDGIAASIGRGVLPPTGDPTIDGWLALRPLTGLTDDGAGFRAALIDWRDRFPNHPAIAGILAEQLALLRGDSARPMSIALLLPLSGPSQLPAEAVLEGFFAARLAANTESAPAIRVFDTGATNAVDAYYAAQLSGADFIVGPLLQTEVELVVPQAGLVPTLALNVPPANVTGAQNTIIPSNFFQFALSSDDEIEAIATRAIADGHRTAAVLFDLDDRGRRQSDSFRVAFELRGGRVVDAQFYEGGNPDRMLGAIEDLLNITESRERLRRLRNTLNVPLEFEPRRRADIDMIFLQADPLTGPEDARLLVPLLEGNDAADIPTYATSTIYNPARRRSDSDIDGLIIPELPLLVDPVGDARAASDVMAQSAGRGADYDPRLWGFGFDAYHLAESVFPGGAASWPLRGATGQLYLLPDGRIRRVLAFGEFSGGRLQPVDRAAVTLTRP